MAKAKTPKAPKAPKVEKAPKIDPKTGLPRVRKPRAKLDAVATLKAQAAKLAKSKAHVDKINAKNDAVSSKIAAKLALWGFATVSDITEGFAPPTSKRASKTSATFTEGESIELKPDFVAVYSAVYSAAELASMTYSFYDEVSKVAMVTTGERVMAVKLKHVQKKVDAAPVVA